MISTIIKIIKSISLKDILYLIIICLLGWLLYSTNVNYNDERNRYENNILAFKDTVSYYESKTGELIAMKTVFECDIKELETLNESLNKEIKDLRIKNEILSGVYIDGKIENPSVDTVFQVKHDTIYNGFNHKFNFNNKWRNLEGYIDYVPDSLKMKITKDEVFFDYTLAMDNKNNIYLKSSNPYIKYNEFSGFTIPKEKKKKFVLGPSINYGYDFINNKPSLTLGVSLTYKIFEFNF